MFKHAANCCQVHMISVDDVWIVLMLHRNRLFLQRMVSLLEQSFTSWMAGLTEEELFLKTWKE